MKHAIKFLRRIVVLSVGIPLLIVGIILIPLPGPGILVSMAALFILSLEFDAATPYFEKMQAKLKQILAAAKQDKK